LNSSRNRLCEVEYTIKLRGIKKHLDCKAEFIVTKSGCSTIFSWPVTMHPLHGSPILLQRAPATGIVFTNLTNIKGANQIIR